MNMEKMMGEQPKDGGPAFPYGDYNNGGEAGMTLRDWFAGQALVGELASSSTAESCEATACAARRMGRTIEHHIACNCYMLADAMLAARARATA